MRSGLGRAVRRAMTANGVTRRRFVMGAAALPVVGCAAAAGTAPVAVIGGGLAGLTAALTLADAGIPAQVYEASPRLGGRVKTSVLGDGLLVEEGAEFIDADHTEMLSLCRRFNLPLFNRAEAQTPPNVPRTAYFYDGVYQNPEELERLLAPLARQIEADLAVLEEDETTHAPRIDALSAAQYLDAIPLDPRARWIAETTIRTEYGVEPEASSALQLVYSLPGVDTGGAETAEAYTLKGGNAALAEAIAAALPLPPLLTRAVDSLRRSDNGYILGGKYPNTEFVGGSPNLFLQPGLGAVIVALPPGPASTISYEGVTPPRPVALGRNEKQIVAFQGRPWRAGGFAVEALVEADFSTVWDATLRQSTPDGALTFFSGGARAMETADVAARLATLSGLAPRAASAEPGATIVTAWSDNPVIGGAYTSFAPGEMTYPERVFWGRGRTVIDGHIAFAGEHLSESHYGYMEGAAQTGRLAAEAVLRALNR